MKEILNDLLTVELTHLFLPLNANGAYLTYFAGSEFTFVNFKFSRALN